MMLAVINGLMPTSTILICARAPPLIRLRKPPKSLLPITLSIIVLSLVGSASGTGICAMKRKAISNPSTMPRRFCISRFLRERNTVRQFISVLFLPCLNQSIIIPRYYNILKDVKYPATFARGETPQSQRLRTCLLCRWVGAQEWCKLIPNSIHLNT